MKFSIFVICLSLFSFSCSMVATTQHLISPDTKLLFEHSGLDVAGNPETLAGCDVALTTIDVDLQGPNDVDPLKVLSGPSPVQVGDNEYVLTELLSGLPDGVYRLWVRVHDVAGNSSDWSDSLLVMVDRNAPSPAQRLRVIVN